MKYIWAVLIFFFLCGTSIFSMDLKISFCCLNEELEYIMLKHKIKQINLAVFLYSIESQDSKKKKKVRLKKLLKNKRRLENRLKKMKPYCFSKNYDQKVIRKKRVKYAQKKWKLDSTNEKINNLKIEHKEKRRLLRKKIKTYKKKQKSLNAKFKNSVGKSKKKFYATL